MSYFSAAVYVEGDIETRVYNDDINNQVKNVPEIDQKPTYQTTPVVVPLGPGIRQVCMLQAMEQTPTRKPVLIYPYI